MNAAHHTIPALAQQRVLVAGDMVLDRYIYGRAMRLSREAPIPVLEWVREQALPGGAANPAANIAALGAQAIQAGVVGDDAEGRQVVDLLSAAGVDPACVVVDQQRPTTVKTRIMAEGALRFSQQLARIDRIDRTPLAVVITERLVRQIAAQVNQIDALLCSDYLSGLLTPQLVDEITRLCHDHHVVLAVDAQGELDKYMGVDLLRCNNEEAARFLGYALHTAADYQRALDDLLYRLQPRLVVVTRGRDGLSLQGHDQPYMVVEAHRVEAADTTGAGDTFSAVMTLALAAGMPPLAGATLANTAAGLVVRRIGNAVVTPQELAAAMSNQQ